MGHPDLTPRSPSASSVVTTHMVLPPDTNVHGSAFGGKIMQWMDIAAAVAASRHCSHAAVTVAVDDLYFARPIRMGDIVTFRACVNFTGKSSMEVGVRVDRENLNDRSSEHCLTAYLTFVGVDPTGNPVPVPPIRPETPEEIRRYAAAQQRRARRLQNSLKPRMNTL